MERTSDNPDLTRSELTVAQLVVTGLSNDEVADALDRSTNTVKTHLRHVYQKLGVRNRTELVQALACYVPSRRPVAELIGTPTVGIIEPNPPAGWAMDEPPLLETPA